MAAPANKGVIVREISPTGSGHTHTEAQVICTRLMFQSVYNVCAVSMLFSIVYTPLYTVALEYAENEPDMY